MEGFRAGEEPSLAGCFGGFTGQVLEENLCSENFLRFGGAGRRFELVDGLDHGGHMDGFDGRAVAAGSGGVKETPAFSNSAITSSTEAETGWAMPPLCEAGAKK